MLISNRAAATVSTDTTWQPAAVSAPQAHFLIKFFLMFVRDTSAFRFLQQIRLSDDCTITVNQSEIVGQDPVHHSRVSNLNKVAVERVFQQAVRFETGFGNGGNP
jgi:hypothetical protein